MEAARAPCRDRTASEGPEPAGRRRCVGRAAGVDGGHIALRRDWAVAAGAAPRCDPLEMPASTDRQFDPILRGSRLWWREGDLIDSAVHLRGLPRALRVPARLDATRGAAAFAGSETRLAWVTAVHVPAKTRCMSVARPRRGRVRRGRSACSRATGAGGAVDQHRVVWSGGGPGGDLDIYFCEDDAHTGACPVQRLTVKPGRSAQSRDLRHARGLGGRARRRDDDRGLRASLARSRPPIAARR